MTVKLFPVTSEHAEATWQKGRGLCLPLVLLAAANVLDVVTTSAMQGTELNPIADWLLRRDWLHEPRLLGQRHEGIRRQQSELGMAPACEGFEADDLSGGEVELGLVIEQDLVAVDRPAQAPLQRQATRNSLVATA